MQMGETWERLENNGCRAWGAYHSGWSQSLVGGAAFRASAPGNRLCKWVTWPAFQAKAGGHGLKTDRAQRL